MIVYHMSDTLTLGDELKTDFKQTMELALPFVQALEQSVDCFYAMVLNGKYLRAVLGKFKHWEWSDYIKWSVEGVFEYIRKTEFLTFITRITFRTIAVGIQHIKHTFQLISLYDSYRIISVSRQSFLLE